MAQPWRREPHPRELIFYRRRGLREIGYCRTRGSEGLLPGRTRVCAWAGQALSSAGLQTQTQQTPGDQVSFALGDLAPQSSKQSPSGLADPLGI